MSPETKTLLPEMFTASDATIQAAHNASLLRGDTPVESARAPYGSRNRNGEVSTLKVDPLVMAEARRLAGGDLGRITIGPDGTVLVR